METTNNIVIDSDTALIVFNRETNDVSLEELGPRLFAWHLIENSDRFADKFWNTAASWMSRCGGLKIVESETGCIVIDPMGADEKSVKDVAMGYLRDSFLDIAAEDTETWNLYEAIMNALYCSATNYDIEVIYGVEGVEIEDIVEELGVYDEIERYVKCELRGYHTYRAGKQAFFVSADGDRVPYGMIAVGVEKALEATGVNKYVRETFKDELNKFTVSAA